MTEHYSYGANEIGPDPIDIDSLVADAYTRHAPPIIFISQEGHGHWGDELNSLIPEFVVDYNLWAVMASWWVSALSRQDGLSTATGLSPAPVELRVQTRLLMKDTAVEHPLLAAELSEPAEVTTALASLKGAWSGLRSAHHTVRAAEMRFRELQVERATAAAERELARIRASIEEAAAIADGVEKAVATICGLMAATAVPPTVTLESAYKSIGVGLAGNVIRTVGELWAADEIRRVEKRIRDLSKEARKLELGQLVEDLEAAEAHYAAAESTLEQAILAMTSARSEKRSRYAAVGAQLSIEFYGSDPPPNPTGIRVFEAALSMAGLVRESALFGQEQLQLMFQPGINAVRDHVNRSGILFRQDPGSLTEDDQALLSAVEAINTFWGEFEKVMGHNRLAGGWSQLVADLRPEHPDPIY